MTALPLMVRCPRCTRERAGGTQCTNCGHWPERPPAPVVRRGIRHIGCGARTSLSKSAAETIHFTKTLPPQFRCANCEAVFEANAFVWDGTTEIVAP